MHTHKRPNVVTLAETSQVDMSLKSINTDEENRILFVFFSFHFFHLFYLFIHLFNFIYFSKKQKVENKEVDNALVSIYNLMNCLTLPHSSGLCSNLTKQILRRLISTVLCTDSRLH